MIYETADYAVELLLVPNDATPSAMWQKYAVIHKKHKVIAGVTEQLSGAIGAVNDLQQSLDELAMQLLNKPAPLSSNEVN